MNTYQLSNRCNKYLLDSSESCIPWTISEYIDSWKMSSAFFMLKVQHIPLSVGRVLKMAGHEISFPFQNTVPYKVNFDLWFKF